MLKYQLKESEKHGNEGFPMSLYSIRYEGGERQILPCHWHEECEIIYLAQGSALFKIGEEVNRVKSGQALLVNSTELHSAWNEEKEGGCYQSIVFKANFLGSSTNDVCQSNYISNLIFKRYALPVLISGSLEWEKLILTAIRNIIDKYLKKPKGYEIFIKGSLYILFSYLAENEQLTSLPFHKQRAGREMVIKTVLEYLEQNYSKKITVDETASLVNLSRYHFCRVFKEYTGMTLIDYVNMLRINKAAHMLQNGNCQVFEVAMSCGFENLSYFTRLFKRYMNILPSRVSG